MKENLQNYYLQIADLVTFLYVEDGLSTLNPLGVTLNPLMTRECQQWWLNDSHRVEELYWGWVDIVVARKLASSNQTQVDFAFNGKHKLDGLAYLNSDGHFMPKNSSTRMMGHAFYNFPIQFKNHTNGSVLSFSTTFIFAMEPDYPKLGGHGIAFVISPSKDLKGAMPSQYLGLFNSTNDGHSSNHVVAVELDAIPDFEFNDLNGNHVGVDINSLKSVISAPAGYYTGKNGGFKNLTLKSGDPMQVWVEYDGIEKQLNVTLSPVNIPKPNIPLLSLSKDLSPFLLESMYVGFSSSTGLCQTDQYLLGWSFKMNGSAQELDRFHLPKLPFMVDKQRARIQKILTVVLSLTGSIFSVLLVIYGALIILRRKKFMEILEDWEVQYGAHRFTYKDLFIATKGFKDKELLGQGGFGKVYRGLLPTSNKQIAVKRVAHDSRQGMREFVAEIATIGRLRHPNLVTLLGYCRRKRELLLVYDYMPNGSLDKFLYGQPKGTLNWEQRFKVIKDVALGLCYLHQKWLQVVIHRDIKASNVLIDSEMNGRLGDFGLAKLCDHGTDPQTSHVAGTLGYIAPELARTGKATTSTDLFAFGAFMLEVVCGRRPVEPRAPPDEIILVDWVFECWESGRILEAVDPRLENEYVVEEVELVLELGLLCSHVVAAARPSMSIVVQYLEGEAQLPNNLSSIIKSNDFDEGSSEEGVPQDSMPSLTITDSFVSEGSC
ncbi:hypothetical protein F0562_017497 [Nyssa sinensis]|uniref:non-specific serine/threonine protein kinase n=1 Tax=Nyssa sinensis TaxID=561372 RepID=A0A5J4ZJ57_9ASTE|nr:hypothetical protein F0562_017497 [Nyssa sinensis]